MLSYAVLKENMPLSLRRGRVGLTDRGKERLFMKFSCDRNLLLAGLTVAARAAAAKSPIPALEGLLLTAGEDELVITGYNLKTGVRTRVPADISEGGSIVLNARLFGDIVRKMSDSFLKLEADASMLVKLSCGRSDFEIMGTNAEDFPELPTVEEENTFHIQEKKLKAMIDQTIFAVSTNESRPVHTGSLFEAEGKELTVVSVDGFRLALRREELEEDAGDQRISFVVPAPALTEVGRIAGADSEDSAAIHLGSRHILFTIGSSEVISRKLEGEFLDYRKSISNTVKYDLLFQRRELLETFERVSLVINEKYKSPVRCRFGDGAVTLTSATALGKATDVCPMKGSGEDLEIGFNNRFMLDALRAAPVDELKLQLSSGSTPCVMVPGDGGDSFLYLVLPVRIRSEA